MCVLQAFEQPPAATAAVTVTVQAAGEVAAVVAAVCRILWSRLGHRLFAPPHPPAFAGRLTPHISSLFSFSTLTQFK